VRPRLANEENKLECSISFPEENSLVLRRKNKSQDGQSEFRFDKVFGPSSSQENVSFAFLYLYYFIHVVCQTALKSVDLFRNGKVLKMMMMMMKVL